MGGMLLSHNINIYTITITLMNKYHGVLGFCPCVCVVHPLSSLDGEEEIVCSEVCLEASVPPGSYSTYAYNLYCPDHPYCKSTMLICSVHTSNICLSWKRVSISVTFPEVFFFFLPH